MANVGEEQKKENCQKMKIKEKKEKNTKKISNIMQENVCGLFVKCWKLYVVTM